MDWPRFPRGRLREQLELEPATDARRADDESPLEGNPDPDRARRVRLRRGAFLLCMTTFFMAGSLVALVGRGGYVELHSKREVARNLRAEVATLKLDVELLDHAVQRLQGDSLEKERIAREQLGLVLPGEIDFLLPESLPDNGRTPVEGRAQPVPGNSSE